MNWPQFMDARMDVILNQAASKSGLRIKSFCIMLPNSSGLIRSRG
jgi:hypothetical protein